MSTAASGRFTRFRNRIDARRFEAQREALLQEERDALRVSMFQTSLRDRSAVQAVADVLHVDPSTVYAWVEGKVASHPLRLFCDLLDACIAGKGEGNDRALEIARLIYRRYLAPAPAPGAPALCHGAELLHQAGEAIAAWSALVDGCATAEEARAAIRELDDVVRAANAARALAEAVVAAAPFAVEAGS